MLNMSARQLIASNINQVSLHAIVAQVHQLANDSTASAADIAHAIGQDPVLTAQLLKIVNSPFYRFPSRIDALSMAITVLGTRQIMDLVIAVAVIKHFQRKIDPVFNIEAFWCHSITTAIVSRQIALMLLLTNSEGYFVTGLVHDIGKLVMYLTLPNESITLLNELKNANCDIDNIESQVFGFTHDDVGVALLSTWQFPESSIESIRAHTSLEGPEPFLKDAALLHLANNIANNLQAPISRDDDTLLNPRAAEMLQLTPDMIEAVYEESYSHLDELLEIFYYDLADRGNIASPRRR